MQIVIDITEQDYELACKYPDALISVYAHAIKKGTVLPKGHGDLIDACEEMRLMQSYNYDTYEDYLRTFDMLDNAPTVIEADKGETEWVGEIKNQLKSN